MTFILGDSLKSNFLPKSKCTNDKALVGLIVKLLEEFKNTDKVPEFM